MRNRIQRQLIDDIHDAGIFGCVAVTQLDGWRKRRELFSEFLGKDQKKFNEPHLLAHRQCIHLMLRITEEATKEPIRFEFDQNEDTGGRAREWYHLTVKSNATPTAEVARMGPYFDKKRTETIGLQAADLLARSAFRYFNGDPSWQWNALTANHKVRHLLFNEPYWQQLEEEVNMAQGTILSTQSIIPE